MYRELATWWPLVSDPGDYREEAELYRHALTDASTIPIGDVLELGCGGGNNASHLGRHWRMTLTDVSDAMLEVSRALNPGFEHVQGDMRTLRLARSFDAVFVHDAICYMTTEDDVRRAIETAFVHTRPGGAALFAPDYVVESFAPGTDWGGHDGADGRALRYLEWTRQRNGSTYVVDYLFALGEPDGSISVEHDRHVEGVFPREFWLRAIADAGYAASHVSCRHSEVERALDLFVGVRP